MSHILYFTAEWCNPCQRTKPIAEELSREGFINFEFIDVDVEVELTKKFEIKSVPTFILIKDNIEVYRTTGAKTRQQLEELARYEK